MTTPTATIELRDLPLAASVGTYDPGDTVPEAHLLDLTLSVAAGLVLVAEDDMARVFDYDPLLAVIDRLARARRYETQEYLLTRIAAACAACPEIVAAEICLRKAPVRADGGSIGLRLRLGPEDLAALRRG